MWHASCAKASSASSFDGCGQGCMAAVLTTLEGAPTSASRSSAASVASAFFSFSAARCMNLRPISRLLSTGLDMAANVRSCCLPGWLQRLLGCTPPFGLLSRLDAVRKVLHRQDV